MSRANLAGDADAALSMMQLADSFFPTGLYTLSHGLESMVQDGTIRSAEQLEPLIEDYLMFSNGTADAVAAAASLRAAAADDAVTLIEIDLDLQALKLAHEAAVSSTRTGKRLLSLGSALVAGPAFERFAVSVQAGEAPGNFAVALGVLGAGWALNPEQIAAVELYSVTTGLLGAAMRLMRLDHLRSQAIVHRLKPLIATTAADAAATPYQEMRSFAPAIEIAQMQHERANLRLFAS
jgi:urease accessory protein